MQRRVGFIVVGVAVLVALSGCLKDAPGAPKDPELVAENAIRAFGSSAGTQDGGDIKRMTGTFEAKEGSEGSAFMSLEEVEMEMTMEWGRDDVVHVTISMISGGMSMRAEAWCTPAQNLFKWGNTIYESRAAEGEDAEDALCGDSSEFEQPAQGLAMFQEETFDGIEQRSIRVNDDGTITAEFYSPQENATITATIDKKGRVSRMVFDSPEATGHFDIEYGAREGISPPPATQRLPADAYWSTDFEDHEQVLTIITSPQHPPLKDMEARLTTYDWETGEEETIVGFATDVAGPQQKAGYTFEYRDLDGDGRLSEGDIMTFAHAEWTDSWSMREEVKLYDHWADAYVNEGMAPGPGLVGILLAGLAAACFVARRR